MNKTNYISLIMVLFALHTNAQTIGHDTDGYSNLILPSAQLNLDIANNIATIDYVNYFKGDFLYGIRLSGEEKR